MPMQMTKGLSNRSSFCDIGEAFTAMEEDGIGTHWVLEHSDNKGFGVAGHL